MNYKVKVVEEIRYNIEFDVEANSKEEACDIVRDDILEEKIIEEDITYFDIVDVHEV